MLFSLKKCYTCNTIDHKKSLIYFLVVEKKNVQKNVKSSRFECPSCKSFFIQSGFKNREVYTLKTYIGVGT